MIELIHQFFSWLPHRSKPITRRFTPDLIPVEPVHCDNPHGEERLTGFIFLSLSLYMYHAYITPHFISQTC